MEQYLQEQIKKGSGHLEDIFMDMNSIKNNRILDPYAAGTQVNMYHNDRWQDKTPTQ